MKNIWWVAVVAILFSCGTEVKKLGYDRKKPEGKDEGASRCPDNAGANFHRIKVELNSLAPEKLSLEVDGRPELNECNSLEEVAPLVLLDRTANDEITFTVEHGKFYTRLPATVSFKLFDLGDCKVAPRQILAKEKIPLVFKKETKKDCAPTNFAEQTVRE